MFLFSLFSASRSGSREGASKDKKTACSNKKNLAAKDMRDDLDSDQSSNHNDSGQEKKRGRYSKSKKSQ